MKTLSGYAEWFWLMARNIKPIENRKWPLPNKIKSQLPLHIYLHASKKKATFQEVKFILDRLTNDQRREFFDVEWEAIRGHIIAEITLVEEVTEHDSPWFFGPYGFVVKDGKLLDSPVPWRGQLGFFDVELENQEVGGSMKPGDKCPRPSCGLGILQEDEGELRCIICQRKPGDPDQLPPPPPPSKARTRKVASKATYERNTKPRDPYRKSKGMEYYEQHLDDIRTDIETKGVMKTLEDWDIPRNVWLDQLKTKIYPNTRGASLVLKALADLCMVIKKMEPEGYHD